MNPPYSVLSSPLSAIDRRTRDWLGVTVPLKLVSALHDVCAPAGAQNQKPTAINDRTRERLDPERAISSSCARNPHRGRCKRIPGERNDGSAPGPCGHGMSDG